MEITLGTDDRIDRMYYVPVLKSLERLLNDDLVLEEVCVLSYLDVVLSDSC